MLEYKTDFISLSFMLLLTSTECVCVFFCTVQCTIG